MAAVSGPRRRLGVRAVQMDRLRRRNTLVGRVPRFPTTQRGIMSEVVNCPKCERKLRVPEELLGKKVKCPTCSETFTATAAAGGGEAPLAPVDEPAPRRP